MEFKKQNIITGNICVLQVCVVFFDEQIPEAMYLVHG